MARNLSIESNNAVSNDVNCVIWPKVNITLNSSDFPIGTSLFKWKYIITMFSTINVTASHRDKLATM